MNWLYWELWVYVGYESISYISYFSQYKLNQTGPKRTKFQNLNFLIFHAILIQNFAKCSSLWVTYDSLKKLSSSFCCQYPKFCIFGRYTQFLFFNLLWCSFHLIDYDKRVVVFKATFNNISVILWWSVFLVEETGVNHQVTDKSLSHIVVHPSLSVIQTHNISGDRYWFLLEWDQKCT